MMVTDKNMNPIGFRNKKIINVTGTGSYVELLVPSGVGLGSIFITGHDGDDDSFANLTVPTEFHMKVASADTAYIALNQLSLEALSEGESVGFFRLEVGQTLAVLFRW